MQPNARAHGQFGPPVAQSAPRYPALPGPNHSPYGPPPVQASGVAPGHPTSPPIRPGTIGTPAEVAKTPGVAASQQSVSITTSAISTPVITSSHASAAAAAAVVTTPASKGARSRTPTIPPPPPVPTSDHVTRSITGSSKPRQFPHDFVTAGKSLVNSVKSKNQKKNSKKLRSTSEDSKLSNE